MKSIKKKWKILLLCVFLLLAMGFLALEFLLGTIVRNGVQIFAPKLTGTQVFLSSCSVSLLRGRIELRNLEIKNPEGFKTPNAFVLKNLVVQVAPMSILSQKMAIREFLIDGMEVTYEQKLTSSNLSTIKGNMDRFSKSSASSAKEETTVDKSAKEAGAQTEKPPKKFQIDNLDIKNVGISVAVLSGPPVSLPMPPLHMEKVGQEGDGASATEVSVEVMLSLFDGIFKSIQDNSGKLGGNILEGLKGSGKGLLEGGKDAGSSVINEIKSLF